MRKVISVFWEPLGFEYKLGLTVFYPDSTKEFFVMKTDAEIKEVVYFLVKENPNCSITVTDYIKEKDIVVRKVKNTL